MTQKATVLRHLKRDASINPRQALELYSIAWLSARINELRHDGYRITTASRRTYSQYGAVTYDTEYLLG